jgi:putative transposase
VNDSLTLADRTFCCQECGLIIDRDLNAAKTLEKLAASSVDSLNACGEGSAGLGREAQVKLLSGKQEPNTLNASA